MYPLDRGRWGPVVRIGHMRDELSRIVPLDLVSGYRGTRRLALGRYALSGRLRGLDGIYVESSSFLPAEADIGFLGLARALGIPVLTYIRDAYQLLPDYGEAEGLRRWLGAMAFRPAIRALMGVSTRVAFPSAGLARLVLGTDADAVLLPPGSPPPVEVEPAPGANRLLYVGDARLPAHGVDRLVRAVGIARDRGADVGLTVVSHDPPVLEASSPEWLQHVRSEGDEILPLLGSTIASVIPRPRGPYNDLAVPVKLYDYLAFGRPLLVTDCVEQARVVADADAGLVMGDEPEAMAAAIVTLHGAPAEQVASWSRNAHAAARASSWATRARTVVEILAEAA